jgi:hypothetical protein
MDREKLANTIALQIVASTAEPEVEKPEHGADFDRCFSCGHGMVYSGPQGDDSGRFCSDHCRDWFDAGNRPWWENAGFSPNTYTVPHLYSSRGWKVVAGPPGLEISSEHYAPFQTQDYPLKCAGCSKPFHSKGLRCCSTECESQYRERQKNIADMAEVGMERPTKRKCDECGGSIPNWINGRRVQKNKRFCSSRCTQRARKAQTSPEAV